MFGKVINTFLTDGPCVFTILIFTLPHETDLKKACSVLKKVFSGVRAIFQELYELSTDIPLLPFRKKRDKKGEDERATFSIKNDI